MSRLTVWLWGGRCHATIHIAGRKLRCRRRFGHGRTHRCKGQVW